MASREIEWQFETASPRKVAAWLRQVAKIELGSAVKQVDQYYDTADQRLLRSGRSLRVRQTSAGYEATLKSLVGSNASLKSRIEITEPLPSYDLGALAPKGRIRREVRLVTGRSPLVPLVTVTTYRRKAHAAIARTPVEVCVDRFAASHGELHGVCAPRVEVEVSRTTPTVEAFAADLAAACALTTAQGSKLEAAVQALGLEPIGEPPKVAVGEQTTLGGLATAFVRNQSRALWVSEPIARLGEDPEGVHDMRVALRRLRTALKLFGPAFPGCEPLQSEIEWLGDTLSTVRDLDVLIEKTTSWPEARSISKLLRRERRTARRRLVRALDSRRYRLLVAAIDSLSASGPFAATKIDAAAADLVDQVLRKARKAARQAAGGDGDALHLLRRRLKRVRYTVEFLRFVARDESEQFVARLAKLQDALGEYQDLRVQAAWEERLSPHLPEGTLAPVAAERERRESELRKRATRALKSALRKPYKALRRALVAQCLMAWRDDAAPNEPPKEGPTGPPAKVDSGSHDRTHTADGLE